MSGAITKGWCPSLFEPMAAGDGFLLRVKPRAAGVSAAQMRALAAAAQNFGSGRIELTNRANFQARGLSLETVPGFAAAMLAAGLASADPAVERRRNILLPALPDPAALALAQQLEDWLERDAGLAALPAKFGFALAEGAADINIFVRPNGSLLVLPGGFSVFAPEPIEATQALTHAFLRLAAKTTPSPRRMQKLLEQLGAQTVFAEAGLRPEFLSPPDPAHAASVGAMPRAFGLGLAFGVQDAAMICRAADLAERFGNGVLRTTRTRSLVLLGISEARGIEAAAQAAGFITAPGDVRLRVAACAGRPACPSAFADARAVAAGLAPHWAGAGVLHVSACAKGCAAPGGAALTLVAGADETYDVVRDKRAGDVPDQAGLSLNGAIQWMTEQSLYR